jgi:translation elongation factor EF-Tu-like GTPase
VRVSLLNSFTEGEHEGYAQAGGLKTSRNRGRIVDTEEDQDLEDVLSLEEDVILVTVRIQELLSKLDQPGEDNDRIWREILMAMDRKVELVDAEFTRRLVEQYRRLNDAIPELLAKFDETLEQYIPDTQTRQAIRAKIEELFDVIKGSWDNPHEV